MAAWWQPGHPGWAIHPADSERFAATGELHVERFDEGEEAPRLGTRLRARAHAASGTAAPSYTTGSPGTSIVQESSAHGDASVVAAGAPGSTVSGSPRAAPYVLAPAAAANLQQAVLSVFGQGREVVRVGSSPAVGASLAASVGPVSGTSQPPLAMHMPATTGTTWHTMMATMRCQPSQQVASTKTCLACRCLWRGLGC